MKSSSQINALKMQLMNELGELFSLKPYFIITETTLYNINFPTTVLIQFNTIEQHIKHEMRLQDAVIDTTTTNKLYVSSQ